MLEAKWVSESMESAQPKYAPKLPGSINPSTVLTLDSLAHTLQHGLFTSDDAEYNERRRGEAEDQVKTLLHSLHSEMEMAIFQVKEDLTSQISEMDDDTESDREQARLTSILCDKLTKPKFLLSVLESHGIAVHNTESEHGTDVDTGVESTTNYPKTVNESHPKSQYKSKLNYKKTQPSVKTNSNKSHCAKGAMKDKSDTKTGAQKAMSHKFQQGACGPGGPLLRETPSPDAGQPTVSCQYLTHIPGQHIPGGPPDSLPSGVSSNTRLEKPVSPRAVDQRKSASQSKVEHKTSSFQPHSLPSWQTSHKENSPTPSQASKVVSPTSSKDILSHPHQKYSSVSSYPPQKLNSRSQEVSRSLRKDLQHLAEGRTAGRYSAECLEQTNTPSQSRGGGRRKGWFSSESEGLRVCVRKDNQQEREVTCVIPEKYKAVIESENPDDTANNDDIWREFGRVNSQFLMTSAMTEEQFSDTLDIHPSNIHTVKTSKSRTDLQPSSIKTATMNSDVTASFQKDEGISSFSSESGSPSLEHTVSSPCMRSPTLQSGTGRGRGTFHVPLGASQQNLSIKDSAEMKSQSSGVKKEGSSPVPVMGRGQALLELLKKL